jgi:hypothetical protein
MFWKPEFKLPATEIDETQAMREELREIARELRALAANAQPRTPDLLADQIRAQIGRIQMPRAA